MSTPHDGIAVVGASIAGVAAADAIREAGYTGPLHLIDAQREEPYDRPPLSKHLLADPADPSRLRLREPDHWRRLGIELHLGTAATDLDPGARRLSLDDGRSLHCGAIVLAPGSAPRPLPFPTCDAPVHLLRTLPDAQLIVAALQRARRLLVVGAGFVGLEVASAARARGIAVTVVDVAAQPLAAALGAPAAEYLLALHRADGTTFRLGTTVAGIRRLGTAAVAELASGEEIAADAVVAGIGAGPAVDWLARSGLGIDDGLVADARLCCAPGIFAAGDAVNWLNPVYARRMRIEHWTTAREQGAAAGRNAAAFATAGQSGDEFAHVPYVWSDQCGRKAQFVGIIPPGTETVVDRHDERSLVSSHYLAGRLVGRTTVGAPREVMAARRQIQAEWRAHGPALQVPLTDPPPATTRTLEGAVP